jgi:ABC-type polysaccharide/polyol phosphate export permease
MAGVAWFVAAGLLLAVGMYGLAELLAGKVGTAEEYVGAVPAIAIVPFFFAGSLFPISALPWFLTGFAKVLPLTHALALIRYGLLGGNAAGLHSIWGSGDTTRMAWSSLALLVVFAGALTTVSIRRFQRTAVS